ncbi:MAG: polyphenol oxidase family protein [Verrucomicrobiota bacterium]|nr:polyphenol oxidase family protein [Verrucomicrobiota bacterium]
MESKLPAEQFSALGRLNGLVHCFTTRVPGIEVKYDKAEALRRLDGVHREVRIQFRLGGLPFITAEQVHGSEIGVVDGNIAADKCFGGCDGVITNQRGVSLGIYVADCCAIYLVDPVKRAIGVVHSGKKGTELAIAAKAIALMTERFGTAASDLIVQLSPCIRPPHYEIDFASHIVEQCRNAGANKVHDAGTCTACEPARYYSYRAEKGRTGRMLALLALS